MVRLDFELENISHQPKSSNYGTCKYAKMNPRF